MFFILATMLHESDERAETSDNNSVIGDTPRIDVHTGGFNFFSELPRLFRMQQNRL